MRAFFMSGVSGVLTLLVFAAGLEQRGFASEADAFLAESMSEYSLSSGDSISGGSDFGFNPDTGTMPSLVTGMRLLFDGTLDSFPIRINFLLKFYGTTILTCENGTLSAIAPNKLEADCQFFPLPVRFPRTETSPYKVVLQGQGTVHLQNGTFELSLLPPGSFFPQNKQNEPSIAVDPLRPWILVAGANDGIDLAPFPCNGSDCSFTGGVGVSGIYFSFDGGSSWKQPAYTGLSARFGMIGTLPWYYESGLVSNGEPALAFGPRPGLDKKFTWINGSRLYYLNLASNFSSTRTDRQFRGLEAMAVSRTDEVELAAANYQSAWLPPVIVSSVTSSTSLGDKNGIWADNAASSPYFGNVYVCWTSSSNNGSAPEPILLSRSTDGGDTWSSPRQLAQAANNFRAGSRQGCTVRTDSKGVLYVFFEGTASLSSAQMMVRSFDGAITFGRPQVVASVNDVGAFDANQSDFTIDGIGGARTNSYPSVDIANGAPTGTGATDRIVMAWADARNGLNHEQALVQYSIDGGNTWSAPVNAAETGDRPNSPAIAISPNGQNVYLVYQAFLVPWQTTTALPRQMQGVVRKASWPPAAWTSQRGATGDARASSTNAMDSEFLGDYNSIVATNTSGVAAWTDVGKAVDCAAVDTYRQTLTTSSPSRPFPRTDCPAAFGDTDVFF